MSRYAILLLLFGAATHVNAQPAGTQAQAEAAFREGRDFLDKGDFPSACKAFDASYALDATVPTLLNRANCREQNHQLATAWGLFLEAERETRTPSDDSTQKLHQVALDHSQQLAPRVSKLTISVAADSQLDRLEILRDKERVEPAVWNVALPIDGGTYTITARAPGSTEWTTTVTLGAEGDTKTVDIPKLKILTPTKQQTSAATELGARTAGTSSAGHSKRIAGIALGGVAVGAAISGVVFARMSSSAYGAINSEAKSAQPFDPSKQTSAKTDKMVAGVMFGAAGIAAIAGGTLYYLGTRDARAEHAVAIVPLISPTVVGATAGLQF